MAVGLSAVNLANKWLDVLSASTFTGITTVYVKLHTGDPGASGATAAAAGSTTRQSLAWSAASAGAKAISAAPTAWTNGGTSETLTHISLWDASSAGNFLDSIALTASKAWASGDTFTLNTLTITLATIAA